MQELKKLLPLDVIANRELVVPSEVPVPFKDEGLLEYKKDNALFAAQRNDKQPTVSIQYSYVG